MAYLIWQGVAVRLLVLPEALDHGVGPVAARVGAPVHVWVWVWVWVCVCVCVCIRVLSMLL